MIYTTAPRVQRSCAFSIDLHGRDRMRQEGWSTVIGVHEGSRRIRRMPGPAQCLQHVQALAAQYANAYSWCANLLKKLLHATVPESTMDNSSHTLEKSR